MILRREFLFKLACYGVLTYFIFLLFLITIQYIPIKYDVAFLKLKSEEINMSHYKVAFFSHVYSSIFVIALGLTQFSKRIRTRLPSIHKTIGKIYVFLILFVSGPSGLIMSYYANGGIIAQVSFSILSVFWIFFTFKAFDFAKKKQFDEHQIFMIRSYALTLSAISLRLFKFLIIAILGLPPMDTYRIVSILGWVFNLIIVEIIIRKAFSTKTKPHPQSAPTLSE